MRYVQLRAFHNVAVHGGFSRAAEALHLTQPAISDQVRKLETEYDVRLFDRSQKRVTLTETGRRLLQITYRLFGEEEQALDLLSEQRALRSGALSIVADSPHHVMHVLAEFRRRYPAVSIAVRAGNSETVLADLQRYEADIGVLGQAPAGAEYDVLPLGSSRLMAFAAKGSAAARRRSMTLAELIKQPLVLREPGSQTRAKFEAAVAEAGLPLTCRIVAEGREAVREIVVAGGGVGIVSEAEFPADARVAPIRIADRQILMEEAIVCLRARAFNRPIRAFMTTARELAGKAQPPSRR